MADSGDKNTKRDRTLTDKGEDLHQSNKAAYLSKLQKLWTNIEALISDIENQTTLESLRVLNDKLNSIYVKYTATSQEYTNFLVRTKTNESQKEAEYLMDVIKSHNISGRSSANSKRSSILVQKRAELEASKTKLKFAEEEAKIHKQKAMIEEQQELSNAKVSRQKAELQVDLNMLVQKKETEAAKVELEVYEAEEEVRSGLALSEYDVNQDINVVERTNKFVEEQVKNTVNQPTEREDLVTPIQRQYPDFVPTPQVVNVNKTFVSGTSRESIFKACPNNIKVMEETPSDLVLNDQDDSFGMTIFERTKEDNETGTSVEDRTFLEIMNKDMHKDKNDHWIAPLPFRSPRPVLQNNRAHALFRARNLDRTLQRDVLKKYQFTEFMQGILEQGHAELAPPVTEHEECWYLPVFGVYHPRKKDKVRIVFDSSSKYKGISLNDVLLTGPDLTNNLLGVLLRFRKEPIAITADIHSKCFIASE
ncbi:Hypothetical predicted protein [Mytilus galloprovincialis]|uniref:Uncharacterized protein n=1 Tax=Mytilus galloprovincialis TaxID=29158 RepID=A0A8B6CNN2_MYTGA|nr:Hypothetical predicted protein [Mytilus galloprovincialis]